MRYLLLLPLRLPIALILLGLAALCWVLPGTQLLIAHQLKTHGQQATAVVIERIPSRKVQGNRWSNQSYVLQLPQGTRSLATPARYTVGESIDVVVWEDPPATLEIPFTNGQLMNLESQYTLVQGQKEGWLIWLYLASIRKNADDYGITHTTFGALFAYSAFRIIVPPRIRQKKLKHKI